MNIDSLSKSAKSNRGLYKFLIDALSTEPFVYFEKEGLRVDSSNVDIFKFMASFEVEVISERREKGVKKAKENGVKFGRPKIDESKVKEIKNRRAKGESVKSVAKSVGVGVVTVCKYGKL